MNVTTRARRLGGACIAATTLSARLVVGPGAALAAAQSAVPVAAQGAVPVAAQSAVPVAAQGAGPTPAVLAEAPLPAIEPRGYLYDAAGRRDPFVSMVRRGPDPRPAPTVVVGARPAGIAGLSVSEVAFKGTMQNTAGYVGLLQGADTRTYIVRPGDKLLDATVRRITADTMVFLQQETTSVSLKTHEIRKTLRQTDEVR